MDRAVKTAMLLAAGRGARLRPLTDSVPKPLVEVAGQSLLRRALTMLTAAGVERVVVNTHYLAAKLNTALTALRGACAAELVISDESDMLLDSAGGIIKALPLLGAAPFFVLNADSFWRGEQRAGENWRRLAAAFNPEKQDMLLLTVPRAAALVPQKGDFLADEAGRLRRAGKNADSPQAVIYAGGMILNPAIFSGAESGVRQSLNVYFDKALAQGRLYGLKLEAEWFSVGTEAELAAAEARLRQS